MHTDVIEEIAPTGRLRAAINLGNPLLVSGQARSGEPIGVAPAMAEAVAKELRVEISYVTFPGPAEIVRSIGEDVWDICLIAVQPERAATVAFSQPYVEIEATYLVADTGRFQSVADVDRPGVRIAVCDRSAYDLYLSRTLKHAELIRADGLAGALELFVDRKLDALAGLRPALDDDAATLRNVAVLDGRYTAVQQTFGTRPARQQTAAFLNRFVERSRRDGTIQALLEKYGVQNRLNIPAPATS